MELATCKVCRKFFNHTGGEKICPVCKEKLEKKFQEVKDFIRENAGVSVEEVCEKCEVDKKQIQQWIREERLEFTSDSGAGIVCESCGTPITTGRYCDKCKAELASGLIGAIEKPAPEAPKKPEKKSGAKMRFLDR